MAFIQFSKPAIKLEPDDYAKIEEIILSGWVCIGRYVEELENEFIKRFNVKHAIACSNCTQGLIIAMKSAGWRNKRIAVPAFTWPSTIYAIESNIGNAPVFCDIDPKTWLIDLDTLERNSYDAVIAVDTFGNEATIRENKPVIYDAAHGFNLKGLGHRGLAEVVSLSFTKVVTASEGGIILTNDDSIAETARELRRLSSRMEEINAVIALRSIRNYEYNQEKKLSLIQKYKDNFGFDYQLQDTPISCNSSVFSMLLPTNPMRNAIASTLKQNNIEVKIYYEPLVEGMPNTDDIFSRIISLPTYADMESQQEHICHLINDSIRALSGNEPKDDMFLSAETPGKKYLKESGYLKTYLRRQQ